MTSEEASQNSHSSTNYMCILTTILFILIGVEGYWAFYIPGNEGPITLLNIIKWIIVGLILTILIFRQVPDKTNT